MRLVTLNLQHGRPSGGGRIDLDQLAAAVRALDPDVLALQEVDHRQPRTQLADLTAVAGQAMGAVSFRFAASLLGTPGRTWVAATDQDVGTAASFGTALLSRYPVRQWEVLRLPAVGPHLTLPWPGSDQGMLLGEEPRTAVVAQLDSPVGPLVVASTHLSVVPVANRRQLRTAAHRLLGFPDPVVIMGDLNLTGRIPARVTGYRPLVRQWTFPAVRPLVQLDHILLRGRLGPVLGSEARRLPLSDHRALLVDLGS